VVQAHTSEASPGGCLGGSSQERSIYTLYKAYEVPKAKRAQEVWGDTPRGKLDLLPIAHLASSLQCSKTSHIDIDQSLITFIFSCARL
jgi:hypothetical protein